MRQREVEANVGALSRWLPGVEHVRSDELEVTLARLLEAGWEVVGAAYAAIGVLNPERLELEHFITAGLDGRARRTIGARPRGRGVLGLLVAEPQVLCLDDVVSDARGYGFPSGHPVMRSFLGAPILIGGEPWGNLYFAESQAGAFGKRDERSAIDLAAAGAAVNDARSGVPVEREAPR